MVDSQVDVLRHLTEAVDTLTAEVKRLTAQLGGTVAGATAPGGADEALARAMRLAALRGGARKEPQ